MGGRDVDNVNEPKRILNDIVEIAYKNYIQSKKSFLWCLETNRRMIVHMYT